MRLAVRAGNIDEKANEVWLADLMGDLLSQGTETKTAAQVAEAAARMGGSIDVNVGEDRTDINSDVLSEFAPEIVGLIADVVMHPKFPEAELARLKTDRLRRLSIARSQPQQMAAEKFRALLYPDHPYGRLFPTEEMLNGFTIAQVRSWYDANFGAARSHLYIAGKFDGKAIEAAIRKAFGGWKKGPAPAVNPPKPKNEHRLETVDRPGAVQSTIYIGMPVTDPSSPDWVALSVMNSLLGGSFGSRITSNIREQKGYTYSPSSQVSSRYRDAYWVETADVTTKDTGASLKEIIGGDQEAPGRAAFGQGAQGDPELPRRDVRAPELLARRHHRPARVRGPARPVCRIPEHLCLPRLRGDAGAGPADGLEVHPVRQGSHRRRGRQESHRGPDQALRSAGAELEGFTS